MRLKTIVPWQAKFVLKIGLSKLPIGYGLWKRLGIFEHGQMETPDYALGIVRSHLEATGMSARADGYTVLELGPGDSLFSAFIARADGAARTLLVDVGDYASRDMTRYRRLLERLEPDSGLSPDALPPDLDAALAWVGAEYHTNGLQSLRDLPDACVDAIFSQSVLEHVRRDDFLATMQECRRLLRPGGVCSHSVDLKDHLGYALNNLRFSDEFWESPTIANAGFYTNRIRYAEMLDLFRQAGFDPDVYETRRWDRLPTPRAKLREPWRALPEDELLIKGFRVRLRPVGD